MGLFSKKETTTFDVKGMHCPKCVARVTDALQGVEGVTAATVTLEDEKAVVEGHGYSVCLLYTSPSPRDRERSRMPSSA